VLARANTRANLGRVASVAVPLMLAVSLVCTIFFGKAILGQQTTRQTAQRTTADYVLGAHDAQGLPSDAATAARRVAGVAQASGSFATSVVVAADGTNPRAFPARAVDADTLGQVIDLGIASGSLTDLHGQTLAVSTESASLFGWHTGDRVKVWLGDGTPVTLRVAATYTRPLGFGEIVLPRQLVQRHVTHPLDDAVFVTSDDATDRSTLVAGLEGLKLTNPTLEVTTRAQYQSRLEDAAQQQSFAVYLLLGLIVAFCALAVVNAVTMSTAERAREFALLRLVGADKRQVRTMIRAETLIMVTFGLTIGTIIAAPGLAVLNHNLTGSAIPSVSFSVYVGLLAVYTFFAFAAGVVTTRLALRMNPVAAMTARE
jgi:putative ABC transport system permease protein